MGKKKRIVLFKKLGKKKSCWKIKRKMVKKKKKHAPAHSPSPSQKQIQKKNRLTKAEQRQFSQKTYKY